MCPSCEGAEADVRLDENLAVHQAEAVVGDRNFIVIMKISLFVIVENEGSGVIESILLIHNIVRGPLTLC